MRPYDSVTVRGLPIHRVTSARALSTGQPLKFTTRCSIADSVNPDPPGEVTIDVPEAAIDPYATIIALEIAGR